MKKQKKKGNFCIKCMALMGHHSPVCKTGKQKKSRQNNGMTFVKEVKTNTVVEKYKPIAKLGQAEFNLISSPRFGCHFTGFDVSIGFLGKLGARLFSCVVFMKIEIVQLDFR